MDDEKFHEPITGLTEREAAKRLRVEGRNELPASRPQSALQIASRVVREPMFLLLIAIAATYILLGNPREAALLVGAVFVVVGITFYQERKTERTLEALRDLSSPRALVVRDGEQKRIAGHDVVRGDIVVLSEGDRVPADGVLLTSAGVSSDESLLTGESAAVRKVAGAAELAMQRPGGDGTPFVFSGSLVVQGRGLALAKATGIQTEVGKIGRSLQTTPHQVTRLERATRRLVRDFAIAGILLCVTVIVVFGAVRRDWLSGILAGLTMAISVIPEEFPVVLTVFLALGAWRIARQNVLARRIPAIETLGAATALCVDKTGTLTQNRMSVRSLHVSGQSFDVNDDAEGPLPAACREIVRLAALASHQDPFDPMETAIHRLARRLGDGAESAKPAWTMVRLYALSAELLAMTQVWKDPGTDAQTAAAKGAPEAIADMCRLAPAERERLDSEVEILAAQGLRVLGIAKHHAGSGPLPETQSAMEYELVGLLGLADPVRPTVPRAVAECYRAGIRVLMITGDYPATARSVAREIGLKNPDRVVTGREISELSDEDLQGQIQTSNVFARVMPEQKLRIVQALKANGEIVGMTGDGVNDAPALKEAHIGIAMGGRGTDVAREAADLVLLDDDFSSIVHAIRLGRRIYQNLRQAMSYLIAIHVPVGGMSLLPVLFGWPLVLLPVHIVFLELIIDPACATVFESQPEDSDVMSRPPRARHEPLFTRRALAMHLLEGASVLLAVLGVFAGAYYWGDGVNDARALAFTTLTVGNVALIVANVSGSQTFLATLRRPNKVLRMLLLGVPVSLAVVLYVPLVRDLFLFATLHPADILLCLVAGTASAAWPELVKAVFRRPRQPRAHTPLRV